MLQDNAFFSAGKPILLQFYLGGAKNHGWSFVLDELRQNFCKMAASSAQTACPAAICQADYLREADLTKHDGPVLSVLAPITSDQSLPRSKGTTYFKECSNNSVGKF